MKIQFPLNGKVQLAFGCAILVLLVVGLVSMFGMAASIENEKWVRHTRTVLYRLQDLLSSMQTIEDDYRGFAITGEDIYLKSYREAMMNVEQDEASIRVLTADNPSQQDRLPSLEMFAAEKMQFGESVIGLRRDKGPEPAMGAIRTGSGRLAMNGFESVVRNMRDEEVRLLDMRELEAERRIGQTKTNLLLGTILGLVVVGAAGGSSLRDSSRRAAAAGALQEQKEKYRSLLEAAPDAIVIADAQGQIVFVSAATERLFGYRSEELVGQLVEMLVPMLFRTVNRQRRLGNGAAIHARFMDEGLELCGIRKDKTEFPAEITLSPSESSEGTLVTAAIRDITVRKDAEKHLAQMEGRYRGLLEAAPDAMVVVNQSGEIVLLNVQAEKQFGYHRDELVGQKVKNIIPEGFAERLVADDLRSAEDALAQRIGTGIELTGRRKDKSEFPIEIMLSPLKSAGETLVTAAIRDISVRRDAENHLAQMEGRYRGLLEAAPDAMVVVNQSGEIVLLNVQAEKQFGYHRDELVGQKVKNIIPEGFAERLVADDLRSAEDALAQRIGTGIELTGRRKDKSEFPIEIMLSPLESAEGILVTAAIRDISVRRDAENHLAQMEGRYRGLLEAAPDAMVVVNQSGEIVLLNVQAEKQFGYHRDELVGQKVKNIIPEGFAERLVADDLRSAEDALAQRIGTGIELTGRRKDKSEFPIEIMLSPLESAEGILVTAAIRDISVRRDAENHLAQMEGRYRGLLEAAPDAMVVVNQSGEIVLLNVQAEKQFGYHRDELVGQKVKNIIPEGFAERLVADDLRSAEDALAQRIGTGIELTGRRKDKSEFPIEIMLSPLESAEGILVTAAIRDISVRRDAENHLAQMEGRYRGLLEAAPDAMVVVNQSGEIVLLNVQAEKQFGYHRDELVGQKVKNIIPEGFAERLVADDLRSAEDALAQRIGTGIELTGRRKDKSEFPIEIMLSPLESAEGILVTAAIRDISVRQEAETHLIKTAEELADSNRELMKEISVRQQVEAELSSSHAEAERLLSSISSILIGVDDRGRITRWNAAAAATFDLPSEAALGRPFEELGIRWQTPEVIANILSIAALGESIRLNELEFRDEADHSRSLGVTIHPIRGEHSQNRGFVFLGVETSQRKQLQEQLRLAQKLEAIGQLAAGVAHEINTPTQFVGDNIHFLQESWNKVNPLLTLIVRLAQPDEVNSLPPQLAAEIHAAAAEAEIDYLVEEVPKALAQSLDGVERVSQIVKAMREFSHPGGLEKQSADLNRAIQAAITVSRNEWKYVADIQADLDKELPLVECVIGQIQQVVLNLLINAAHAIREKLGAESQEKGVINVMTHVVGNMIEIRVEDTGTGIPQELRSRVFEPFFTTKHVGKGTGQGLALVHSLIVKGHSGKIWIESPPGKGATFVIQLPLEAARETENAAFGMESAWVPE